MQTERPADPFAEGIIGAVASIIIWLIVTRVLEITGLVRFNFDYDPRFLMYVTIGLPIIFFGFSYTLAVLANARKKRLAGEKRHQST